MRSKKCQGLLSLLFTFIVLFFVGCTGLSAPPSENMAEKAEDVSATTEGSNKQEVNTADLDMVNTYIKAAQADEIMSASAEGLQSMKYENKQTKEQKNAWELVVDFVRNEASDNPKELDYSIEFSGSSFSVSEDNWTFTGYLSETDNNHDSSV